MTANNGQDEQAQANGGNSGVGRIIKIGLLVFSLIVAGVAVTAIVAGDPENLPFDYEGFD